MRYKALLLDFYGTLVEEDDLLVLARGRARDADSQVQRRSDWGDRPTRYRHGALPVFFRQRACLGGYEREVQGARLRGIDLVEGISNAVIPVRLQVELNSACEEFAPRQPIVVGELFCRFEERIWNGDGCFHSMNKTKVIPAVKLTRAVMMRRRRDSYAHSAAASVGGRSSSSFIKEARSFKINVGGWLAMLPVFSCEVPFFEV
ncbi:MAG: hypothetical protein ACJ8CR_21855 [Roseiflexaceae bacterium]